MASAVLCFGINGGLGPPGLPPPLLTPTLPGPELKFVISFGFSALGTRCPAITSGGPTETIGPI